MESATAVAAGPSSTPRSTAIVVRGEAVIRDRKGFICGTIRIISVKGRASTIQGTIRSLPPGDHGLHICVYGASGEGLDQLGGVYNPHSRSTYGPPEVEESLVGTLRNITAGRDRVANFTIKSSKVTLWGPSSVLGRSVVIRERVDDFGKVSLIVPAHGQAVSRSLYGATMHAWSLLDET